MINKWVTSINSISKVKIKSFSKWLLIHSLFFFADFFFQIATLFAHREGLLHTKLLVSIRKSLHQKIFQIFFPIKLFLCNGKRTSYPG